MIKHRATVAKPKKRDLFGVRVSVTNYASLTKWVMDCATRRESRTVAHLPVHGIVTAVLRRRYRNRINGFDVVAPDGQPVRWALNLFHKAGLKERTYGPEFMLRVCAAEAAQEVGIYLYGSTPTVLAELRDHLVQRFPGLWIAGWESPPFRELSPAEKKAAVKRIQDSGAGVVFIGLGCPRQELFAAAHRKEIPAVQVCVGAAFEIHAGLKPMAPRWMQRVGLEWFFRLANEPQRLWRRYLVTNTVFVLLVLRQLLFVRHPAARSA